MKTKIVYVVVSDEKDIYLEQALLSMYSLKRYNPSARITLLVDSLTLRTLVGKRAAVKGYADEFKAVNVDESLTGMQRSRLIKTNVRNLIDGDFLYIDSDTVICACLSRIDGEVEADMAAVEDLHVYFKENCFYPGNRGAALKIGHDIDSESVYFNSGVIYCRDNERTREFYQAWNQNYIAGLTKGIAMDQPSFALTNARLGRPVKQLADIWNCQVRYGIQFFHEALILHYLTTNIDLNRRCLTPFMKEGLYLDIKREGIIPDDIREYVERPRDGLSPTVSYAMDKYFASQLFRFTYNHYATADPMMSFVMRILHLECGAVIKMQRIKERVKGKLLSFRQLLARP